MGQHGLSYSVGRLAPELARYSRSRVLSRHAGADVLPRIRPSELATPERSATNHTESVAGISRWEAVDGIWDSRGRPTGPVVPGVLLLGRSRRSEPSGGDRRARVHVGAFPELVFSAHVSPGPNPCRIALRRNRCGRSASKGSS